MVHLGIKIKHLIENKSQLNKIDFAAKIGHTPQSLHGIFKKEDVSTALLKTIAQELKIELSEFFVDRNKLSVVSESAGEYQTPANCDEVRELNKILVRQNQNCQTSIEALNTTIAMLTAQMTKQKTNT